MSPEGDLMVLNEGDRQPTVFNETGLPNASVSALAFQCRDDCLALVDSTSDTGEETSWLVSRHAVQPAPEVQGSDSLSSDMELLTGVVRRDSDTVCSGVVASQIERVTWQTCAYRSLTFSPTTAYVVGTPVESDGLGPRELAILDGSTGAYLWGQQSSASTVVDYAWEDETHLLLVWLDDDGSESIERWDMETQTSSPVVDRIASSLDGPRRLHLTH
jgi:hypothetical protein